MAAWANITKTKSAPAKQKGKGLFGGPRQIAGPRLLLIFCVAALLVIGLVMVYSSSSIQAISEGNDASSELIKQVFYAFLGLLACVAVIRFVPYQRWRTKFLETVWAICVALLVLTAVIGTVGLGAQRWLSIGPISFQPSEFAKMAVLLIMVRITVEQEEEGGSFARLMARYAFFLGIPLVLIFFTQSDLGTTLICVVGILSVLWLSNLSLKSFGVILLICLVLALFAIFLSGYRSDRMSFLNPEADYYGSGYQLVRSFYAFGEGGLFGVGLGNSTEKYLYLPEAETDFIFAIIAEELGLIGVVFVVLLFVGILYAGLQIARYAPDDFGMLIAGSATVMLVFQALLNIGCVIGVVPTTGKPLPFISSGGSSLIASFVLLGLILSVSFGTEESVGKRERVYDRRRNNLRLVRAEQAPIQKSASTRAVRGNTPQIASSRNASRRKRG